MRCVHATLVDACTRRAYTVGQLVSYQWAGAGRVEPMPVLVASPTGGFLGMQPCSEPPTQLCDADMLLYTSGPAPRAVVWRPAGCSPLA